MDTNEKNIGGTRFVVKPFGAWQGMRVSTQLADVMSRAGFAALTGDKLGAALRASAGLDPAAVEAVVRQFAEFTTVYIDKPRTDGPGTVPVPFQLSAVFDDHFARRYDHLIDFVVFAFKVNYAESFERGKGLIGQLLGLKPLSQSPSTSEESDGSSSESSQAGGTS